MHTGANAIIVNLHLRTFQSINNLYLLELRGRSGTSVLLGVFVVTDDLRNVYSSLALDPNGFLHAFT